MDLQEVLARLNWIDEQANRGGIDFHTILEDVRELAFDLEQAIGEEG